MTTRELRYGDVLRSYVRPEYLVMYLGDASTPAFDYVSVLPLAGANVNGMTYVANGEVVRISPLVLAHFEMVENGPELPRMA